MTQADIEQQKEQAFRASFARGWPEINVFGPHSTSVMQWGIEHGYIARVGTSTLYKLTAAGRKEFPNARYPDEAPQDDNNNNC